MTRTEAIRKIAAELSEWYPCNYIPQEVSDAQIHEAFERGFASATKNVAGRYSAKDR